jgi:hypothetical protein
MSSVVLSRATIASVPTSVLAAWFNRHGGMEIVVPSPCTAEQRAFLEDRCLNLLGNDGLLRYASGLRYSGGAPSTIRKGEGQGEIVVKPDGKKVRRFSKMRNVEVWTGGKWVNRKVKPIVEWDPNTIPDEGLERRSSSSDAGIHSIDLVIDHTDGSSLMRFPSIAACLRHMIASDSSLNGMDWTIAGKIRAMLLAKKEQARIREALASTRAWLDRRPRSPRLYDKYSFALSSRNVAANGE